MALPTDKQERKNRPMARGVLDYFPDALAEVAYVSQVGNEQHNPGQPMHWAKHLSTDHADCIMRHLVDRGKRDPTDGLRESAKVAWRALAMLQIELEEEASQEAHNEQRLRKEQGYDVVAGPGPMFGCGYCHNPTYCDRIKACARKVDDPH
jgi:Domain of unknown function (DUF5664)